MPYQLPNGKWRGEVKLKDKPRLTVTKNTREEALEWEQLIKNPIFAEKEQKRLKQKMEPVLAEDLTATLCLIDMFNAYLDDFKLHSNNQKTYEEKVRCIQRLFKLFDSKMQVKDFTRRHMKAYMHCQVTKEIDPRTGKPRTGNSANKDMKNLKAAYNWALMVYDDLPEKNPFIVPKMPEAHMPHYMPPESDFWKVYNICSVRDKVLLLAFYYTAARKSEILLLKWNDVDFANSIVWLKTGKRASSNEEYDRIPIADELAKELLMLPKSSEYVFISELTGNHYYGGRNKFMAKMCELAGVKPFGFHGIRRMVADKIYAQAGACNAPRELVIQKLLRHQSAHTTARYITANDITPLADILNDIKPNVIDQKVVKKERESHKVTTLLPQPSTLLN